MLSIITFCRFSAGREIPVAKVPPKAKEHDPNAVKPKVYGNITVSND